MLGLNAREAAASVIRIVNNAMAEALRIVSVERGHDPREFSLIAFGGAGPLHAAALAEELGMPEVIVPPIPGGFSALGLVCTDIRRDYARTLYSSLAALDPARVEAVWKGMEDDARAMLAQTGVPRDEWEFSRSAGLRYSRQAYELSVPASAGLVSRENLDALAGDFHALHHQTYGHHTLSEPVHMTTLRLTAIGRLPALELRHKMPESGSSLKGTRRAWFERGGDCEAQIHDRARMPPGQRVAGPAIIESFDSTVVVPPDWVARNDDKGFIRMEPSR